MKKLVSFAAAGLLAASCLLSAPAKAAAFLKIPDIEGESTDAAHKGEIELISWSWGESPTPTRSTGLSTGKRQHRPLTLTKRIDKSSPLLQRAKESGKPIESLEVTLPKEGGEPGEYVTYTLKNVYVTSYQTSGSGSSATETFSLNYEEIKTAPVKRAVERVERKG